MKKLLIYTLLLCAIPALSMADEGMWMVNLFEKSIYPQMKKAGLKLDAKEIYNEQSTALSGAIVAVDYGMGTGSIISENGLVITNHHVAYGDIQKLSTPEKNYLEDGFWALDSKDELPIEGKTVMFLRKVLDVTDEVNTFRDSLLKTCITGFVGSRRIIGTMEKRYGKQTEYEVACASMWRGEKYYMFFYDVYTDVRLVGAPPVKIGAFGGEQDNWQWPQHKGDFALYRVYTDKNGRPATYSQDNQPLKPTKVLSISTSGIHDGDYAMVMGFPGRTNRYMSSWSVAQKQKITNPIIIKARRERLDIMKNHMETDPKIRLMYADKYFGLSNYADYARWENICLRRYSVIAEREKEEQQLATWISHDPERIKTYGTLLDDLKRGYQAQTEAVRQKTYYMETWISPSNLLMTGNRFAILAARMQRENKIKSVAKGDKEYNSLVMNTRRMYKAYEFNTDKELLTAMLTSFTDSVPRNMWGDYLATIYDKYNGDIKAIVDYSTKNTCTESLESIDKFFETSRTAEDMLADPMVALAGSVSTQSFTDQVNETNDSEGVDVGRLATLYTMAIYKMRESMGIAQSPDANSTMRITYGNVGDIKPYDAVRYDYRSTIGGYKEKYNPENYEFRVDERMQNLIKSKDWGRWGEKGELYVNFLTNNDITGGNSGSPVLNANGNVIGLAFDGNRESMSGDIYFHPQYSKTVCVDIRFVLWIMDKYAGAGSLINEMNLVK